MHMNRDNFLFISEAKTRTVSNDGCYPIFNETFEFHINLPELALIRFVVLDDEYIGDDFIGQCTVPFECLQTGKFIHNLTLLFHRASFLRTKTTISP